MKFSTFLITGSLLIFIPSCAFGYWLTGTSPTIDGVDIAYAAVADDAPIGSVTVQFMGNTNLLISDGETAILSDGYFTRRSTTDILFRTIAPDMEAIDRAMARGNVGELAAVIPVHSHFDHAIDSPEVAKRTGALLVGSESTANIGRGWGLPEEQIRVVESGEAMTFGKFTITLIESKHYVFPGGKDKLVMNDPIIREPLVPPVKAGAYAEGGAYGILIEHPAGTAYLQGSAGYVPNGLDDVEADVLFLGIGGVASQTAEYQAEYWNHVVEAIAPKRIYPVHWDSLSDPLGETPVIPDQVWSRIGGFAPVKGLRYVATQAAVMDGTQVELLPMWESVLLFESTP